MVCNSHLVSSLLGVAINQWKRHLKKRIPRTHLLQGTSVEEIPVESSGMRQVILSSGGWISKLGAALLNSHADSICSRWDLARHPNLCPGGSAVQQPLLTQTAMFCANTGGISTHCLPAVYYLHPPSWNAWLVPFMMSELALDRPQTPSESKRAKCLPAKQVLPLSPVDECCEASLRYGWNRSYYRQLQQPNRSISAPIPKKPSCSPYPHAHWLLSHVYLMFSLACRLSWSKEPN